MPQILFASNSVSHFPGAEISAISSTYSSARVPYSIKSPGLTPISSPYLKGSTTGETWIHFRHCSNNWEINTEEPIIEVTDFNGNRIMALLYHNRNTEGYHLRSNVGGNNFLNTRYLPNPTFRLRTYDIRLKLSTLNARIEIYMNEALVEVHDYPVTTFNLPRYLILGGMAGTSTSEGYFSEIIVADGDTRNARLDLLRPQAVGVYGNWNGPVSSLSDDDPTTGMTTTQVDQNQSTILTPYTGATNISNIVQMTTSVRGQNSPDQLQHLIRMSGVDYLSSAFDLPFSKQFQVTDWAINPATSLPWAASDLTAIEFGFRSGAA